MKNPLTKPQMKALRGIADGTGEAVLVKTLRALRKKGMIGEMGTITNLGEETLERFDAKNYVSNLGVTPIWNAGCRHDHSKTLQGGTPEYWRSNFYLVK